MIYIKSNFGNFYENTTGGRYNSDIFAAMNHFEIVFSAQVKITNDLSIAIKFESEAKECLFRLKYSEYIV